MNGSARRMVATLPETGTPELKAGAFESNEKWPVLERMAVPLAVRVPLHRLRLGDVRELREGSVLASEWPAAEEVPLYAADVPLSWCEFAVVDGVMAARLTRLG